MPPIATEFTRHDESSRSARSRLYAMQQKAVLLDHLVGARDQRRWDRQSERLGGLEINDQLELGRLFDRVCKVVAIDQPTIRRLNTSSTTAR